MAETKVSVRRRENQELIRAKLKGMEYIRQLERLAAALDSTRAELEKVGKLKLKLTKADVQRLATVNLQLDVLDKKLKVIQMQIDLNFRRLKFVLPELKSVELTADGGGDLFASLAEAMRAIDKG